MKKTSFLALFSVLLLLCPCMALKALELGLNAGAGNLAFDPEGKDPLGSNIKKFEGNIYYPGNISIKSGFNHMFGYSVGFDRDVILQNYLSGKITFDWDYIYVEAGPFAGICENTEKPFSAGVLGGIRLAYPGAAFLSFNFLSTLDLIMNPINGNSLGSAKIDLGFWLPHVIPVFSVSLKNYNRNAEEHLEINDRLVRIGLTADIFTKNFPVSVCLGFNYDTMTRLYKGMSQDSIDTDIITTATELEELYKTEVTEELRAMIGSIEIKWQISKPLYIIAGYEMPFFAWAEKPKKRLANEPFFYKFNAGIVLNL